MSPTSESVIDVLRRNGDFVELASSDEYAKYFNHLTKVFTCLVEWYKHLIDGGSTEERLVTGFLSRMLCTVEMLRLKHLYDPSDKLNLDLNQSGFPHSFEIMQIKTDLDLKADKLKKMSPENMLKIQMLDRMIEEKEDPAELLAQMASLDYFTSIDENKLMLMFTPGELELKSTRPEYRKYLYSWLCFDYNQSLPFFHLLAFDQDIEEEPLENRGPAFDRFIEVIKKEGSRASSVLVLSMSIDEALPSIHPKVLKRVRIGPIVAPQYERGAGNEPMIKFLRDHGDPDDFAIKLMSEVAISKGQVTRPRKVFSLKREKRVKEIFAIPALDLRCFEQKANQVFDHIILPHRVLQMVVDDPVFLSHYGEASKIVYLKDGGLNAV